MILQYNRRMTLMKPQFLSKYVDSPYGAPLWAKTYPQYLPELVHGVGGSVPSENGRFLLKLLEVLPKTPAA